MSSRLLAVVGTVALGVCVVCLLVLHFVPSNVHPIHDPVSLYGTTRYHLFYRVQVVASGICALCLLFALENRPARLPFLGLLLLGCYAASRIFIAAFMMDTPGKRTQTGRIHGLLAAIAFAAIALAAGRLTADLAAASPWNTLSVFLTLAEYVTILAAVLFIIVLRVPTLQRLTGIVERGIYLGALCWMGLVIIPLIHL